jgi:NTE family protein
MDARGFWVPAAAAAPGKDENPMIGQTAGHLPAKCDRLLRMVRCLSLIAVLQLLAAGCAHYKLNEPLRHYDPGYGYRAANLLPQAQTGDVLLMLTFSGGGTRAAAFAYGALEALKETEVTLDGRRTRLLDEVDAISGVSGGSFTAAYYGLFGERIFKDFQERFLKKNIEGALVNRILFNPYNWVRLSSPWFARSDLAAEYYDQHVFDGARFSDMLQHKGPMVFINTTDMVLGTRMAFTQVSFDIICSDLTNFPVARACAASSAVPIILTPIIIKNYAGSCGYQMPELLELAMQERQLPDRRFELANDILPYLDQEKKPYLHLIDGGVADNLGLRVLLERVTAAGNAWTSLSKSDKPNAHKIVIVVVNAQTEIDPKWSLISTTPPFMAMVNSYSSIAIARYNEDTLALVRESFSRWSDEIRRGRCPEGQISTAPGSCGDIQFYLVDVKFDALKSEADRTYFKQLPTSFSLKPEQVDRLREAAKSILLDSRDFQRLLGDLQ